jgi:hypothetical protein
MEELQEYIIDNMGQLWQCDGVRITRITNIPTLKSRSDVVYNYAVTEDGELYSINDNGVYPLVYKGVVHKIQSISKNMFGVDHNRRNDYTEFMNIITEDNHSFSVIPSERTVGRGADLQLDGHLLLRRMSDSHSNHGGDVLAILQYSQDSRYSTSNYSKAYIYINGALFVEQYDAREGIDFYRNPININPQELIAAEYRGILTMHEFHFSISDRVFPHRFESPQVAMQPIKVHDKSRYSDRDFIVLDSDGTLRILSFVNRRVEVIQEGLAMWDIIGSGKPWIGMFKTKSLDYVGLFNSEGEAYLVDNKLAIREIGLPTEIFSQRRTLTKRVARR